MFNFTHSESMTTTDLSTPWLCNNACLLSYLHPFLGLHQHESPQPHLCSLNHNSPLCVPPIAPTRPKMCLWSKPGVALKARIPYLSPAIPLGEVSLHQLVKWSESHGDLTCGIRMK